MNNKIINHIWIIVTILASGCDAFLDVPISPQLIESGHVLANERTAQSAVDGVYADMRAGNPRFVNGAISIYAGLAADELSPTTEQPTYMPFYRHELFPNNSHIRSQLWNPAYQNIYRCNTLIAGLRENNTLPEGVKSNFIGQLLVSRALQYIYLGGLFGDVPLVLIPDYTVNAVMGQTVYEDILHQASADLREAREQLPAGAKPSKIRPTYWAATALLSRVSLYLGDYEAAIRLASEVIEGPFILHPDLDGLFLIDGPETIWEIAAPQPTGNSPDGSAFLPSSPTRLPPIQLTDAVVSAFGPDDLRFTHWVGTSLIGPEPTYYPRKYTYRQIGPTHEYMVVLRLAEQYLIRAESHLAVGRKDLARADLNVLRGRAGISSLGESISGNALQTELRNERLRELFSEWGHRWFDLRRWGIIDETMGAAKPKWEPYMALFPLPEDQLRYNYKLTQNPGY